MLWVRHNNIECTLIIIIIIIKIIIIQTFIPRSTKNRAPYNRSYIIYTGTKKYMKMKKNIKCQGRGKFSNIHLKDTASLRSAGISFHGRGAPIMREENVVI